MMSRMRWTPKDHIRSTGPISRTLDGAPDVIVELLCKVPQVSRLFADGGYAGQKLRDAVADPGVSDLIEIVEKPKQISGFTVLHMRWIVGKRWLWRERVAVNGRVKLFRHPETASRQARHQHDAKQIAPDTMHFSCPIP